MLFWLVAACGSGDRIYVDAAGSAVYDGRTYFSISPDRIVVPPDQLSEAGLVTSTNLDVTDRRAYAIAGVPTQQAIALLLDDGRVVTLIPEADVSSGQPLGVIVPGLCPFNTEPAVDSCPPSGS